MLIVFYPNPSLTTKQETQNFFLALNSSDVPSPDFRIGQISYHKGYESFGFISRRSRAGTFFYYSVPYQRGDRSFGFYRSTLIKPPTSLAPSTRPAKTRKARTSNVPPFISKPMAKRTAQIRPDNANKFISFS